MPEPTFDGRDRVPEGAGLPPELQGKTPEQIAQYYQDREQRLLNDHQVELLKVKRQAQPPSTPEPARAEPTFAEPTAEDYWKDPAKATKVVATKVASDLAKQYEASSEPMRRNLVATAELLTERKFAGRKDAAGRPLFERFHEEITRYMSAFQPSAQADPLSWETAFIYVIGTHAEELQAEAARPRTSISEPVSGGIVEPAKPIELSLDEKRVAFNLGMSEDKFKKGKELLEGNKWPMTFSNVRG
jgi:hypothetical protein